MTAAPLDRAEAAARLLAPRSIAVVGASDRSRWSEALVANLERHEYSGPVHLVNARGAVVGGRRTSTSCVALGAPVDLGILLVPAAAATDAVEDLAAAGATSAVILTSGFAETGPQGAARQDALARAAAASGLRLLGPNSLGFVNLVEGTVAWAAPLATRQRDRGLALVSQSGATAYFLAALADEQNVDLSHVVATGNEADLDASTFAVALCRDPRTTAVALFLESVRHPGRFIEAAVAAAEAGKPLVVLKVGSSEVAARSALAHTGALVGDDRVFDGVCARYGVTRVRSLEELVTTADVMGRVGRLGPGGLCVVSNSGGICEIAADTAATLGVELPPLSPAVTDVLRAELPDYATPHNPLDVTGGVDTEATGRIVAAMAGAESCAVLLMPYYPVPAGDDANDRRVAEIHRRVGVALAEAGSPGFLVSYTASAVSEHARRQIEASGLPFLACGMDRALQALAHAFDWSRCRALHGASPPGPSIAERPRSESATLALLAAHGVPVVPSTVVGDEAAAVAAADGFGQPVAVKVASDAIAHKTEIGGVVLGVSGAAEAAAAFRQVVEAGAAAVGPSAAVEAIVTPMRTGGLELFVGCSRDPVWGPVVAVGLGGTWVEVLADVSIRPLPVSPDEVVDMLGELRGHRLLAGERGLPAADLAAVGAVVSTIGDVAARFGSDLVALDVNPLWVRGAQVEALDALAEWSAAGS